MTNSFIALLAAVGVGGWVYNMVQRHTGSASTKNSLIVTAMAALFTFITMLTLLAAIPE